MEHLPITLHGASVLLTGAGRLAQVLARQLRGLGARVTLAARSPTALTWAGIWDCTPLPLDQLSTVLGETELVINTVPAPLFPREALAALRPGCLVIDLASPPAGVGVAKALPSPMLGVVPFSC